jgi:HK97 family phage portal protein
MMKLFRRSRGKPAIENPPVEVRSDTPVQIMHSSDPNLPKFLGLQTLGGAGEEVTIETALSIPALWCAVNFLARTLAKLPIGVFEKTESGRVKVEGAQISVLLNRAPNPETTAFDWRFAAYVDVFTKGRHISFIERNGKGDVVNIWPLDIDKVTVSRREGRKTYHYKENGKSHNYAANDVIDLAFMPSANGLQSRSPIYSHKLTIGYVIAVIKYGARIFGSDGVTPFVVTGPFTSPGAMSRASEDIKEAFRDAKAKGKASVNMPEGHSVQSVGVDPEKLQMNDTKLQNVVEIARIYSLPPTFVQDLTNGTFSNTEQQDLQLVKHTLSSWLTEFEQEINLKLYGRDESKTYAEANLDALLRGDLKSRMEALAQGINTGQLTPNEGRALNNRENKPGGDELFMQGAMAPVTQLVDGEKSNEGNDDGEA